MRFSPFSRASMVGALLVLLGTAGAAVGQELSELPLPAGGNGVSQRCEVSQWIGPVKVTVGYHSPSVHGLGSDRTGHIWGELIPWGMFDEGFGPSKETPWRAGANETTTITFSHDVRVEGKDVRAGTYALFLELAEKGPWTWIFSSHTGWGSFQYDPRNDVLRVPSEPSDAPFTEYLTYGFDDRKEESAIAYLQWEKKRVGLKIEVPDVWNIYVGEMRKNLESWPGFDYRNWQTAAQLCASHKVNLEEALVWADRAIHEPFRGAVVGVENFSTIETKAAVLDALGRGAEADGLMKRALELPGTTTFEIYLYGSRSLAAGKKETAMEAFRLNRKRHPEEKYWTFLGLARGYTAIGDRANAVKSWETVIANLPEAQKGSLPAIRRAYEKAKALPTS